MFMWKWNIKLRFIGNWRKIAVEIFEIAIWLEILLLSTVRLSAEMLLIFKIDFKPFQVFLMLLQSNSK